VVCRRQPCQGDCDPHAAGRDPQLASPRPHGADLPGGHTMLPGHRQDDRRVSRRHDDPPLALAEQQRPQRHAAPRRQIHLRTHQSLGVADATFRDRDREATVTDIVCRPDRPRADGREQRVGQRTLGRQVAPRWRAGDDAVNPGQVLAAPELTRRLTKQHDRRLGIVAESGSRHMAEGIDETDHPDNGRRIDRPGGTLVVQGDIPTGDGSAQRAARFSHAGDRLP
jgi:hypothetical protein